MNKKEFYNIGRGNLNLNGNFYYGLDYEITDFMRKLEEENTNLKQALIEIREYCNNNVGLNQSQMTGVRDNILRMIDKHERR